VLVYAIEAIILAIFVYISSGVDKKDLFDNIEKVYQDCLRTYN